MLDELWCFPVWLWKQASLPARVSAKSFLLSLLGRSSPKPEQLLHCSALGWPHRETSAALWCSLPAVGLSGFLPSKLSHVGVSRCLALAPQSGAFHPHSMGWSFLQGRNPRSYLICPFVSQVLLPHVSMYWKPLFYLFLFFSVVCVCGFRWFCRSCSWYSILAGSGSPISIVF